MRALATSVMLAAAALAACSVDDVRFDEGVESCAAPGDEDGNGLADCADPACAGAGACRPAACGNGRREAAEGCDDGNAVDGDGCDANCTVTACGNGVETAGEVCDDGNAVNGDGCETTCEGTGSGSYEAVADALIRISSGTPDASTNFGALPDLFTYGSSFGTRARSLIAFDLTAIPADAVILSAQLNVRLVGQAGTAYSINVHEVAAAWSEAAVTWNNQPGVGPALATLPFQGYKWWRFDVTELVRRWVSMPGENRGLALRQSPESFPSGGQFARFESREGANRPYLDLVVED